MLYGHYFAFALAFGWTPDQVDKIPYRLGLYLIRRWQILKEREAEALSSWPH